MAFAAALAAGFLLILLGAITLLILRPTVSKHKLNLPPGPPTVPFIGNLHLLGPLRHRSLHQLSQKYGPLMTLKLCKIPAVVASSADTARQFLKTHDLECCSRPRLTSAARLSYGLSDVVFAPYGEQWRELRKISIIHLFSTKKVASFRFIREEEVERMIDSISSTAQSSTMATVNLSEEVYSLANDITCRTALGKRYYSGDRATVLRLLGETQALLTAFFFTDHIPMLGWLDSVRGLRARLERNFHELDEFYQRVIDEHLEQMNVEEIERDHDEDAVDALLNLKMRTSHLTYDHIKGLLKNIFVAGTDTSSTAIEWAMAELMRHPEVMRKAQDEVRVLLGNKGRVEESDLDQLHYLKSVVKETLRLHPPAPLLVRRETMRHCRVDGYDIPPKTSLFINAWAIGRDENVWERPDEFCPERFTSSAIDFRGHDFELIPFGAGRRICPGMHSGVQVVELGLASLLYHFDWELPEGMSIEDIDMGEAPGVTVHRRSALCLVAKKRLERQMNDVSIGMISIK